MPRLSVLLIVFLLGAAASVALASCGESEADLLPGTTADQIESNLTEVERLVDEEDCVGAEEAVAEVAAEVEGLQGVDLKLKAALEEGTSRLSEVIGRCEEETTVEETEPAPEADFEDEEVEEDEKPKKEKPDEDEEEPDESTEEPEAEEDSELPPNGQGEEKSEEGGPPVSPEAEEAPSPPSSGGVGPGRGIE
jgi:hypothetical protein